MNSKLNQNENYNIISTKVVTGKVRFCYVNVFHPSSMSEGDPLKYSICILIPKSDKALLTKINKAIESAKIISKAKLADKNGNIPANLKTPLRDGDIDRSDDLTFKNCYFLNANSNRKPQVVDANLDPIFDENEFYSGCYGRASINFYGYNRQTKGIACGLNNIQKLEDGEALIGGSTPEEDFGTSEESDDDLL